MDPAVFMDQASSFQPREQAGALARSGIPELTAGQHASIQPFMRSMWNAEMQWAKPIPNGGRF
jgi:hypothetical protein